MMRTFRSNATQLPNKKRKTIQKKMIQCKLCGTPFGKRTHRRRIRNTLEKTPPLALGSEQRKNTPRSIIEKTILIGFTVIFCNIPNMLTHHSCQVWKLSHAFKHLFSIDKKTRLIFRSSNKSLINFILHTSVWMVMCFEGRLCRIHKMRAMWASTSLL